MRKTIAVTAATGALLFGGAGVAEAAVHATPVPASTTTVAQSNNNGDNDSHSDDKTGLWGLLGLIGLAGLGGLARRRHDANVGTGITASGTRGNPQV